MDSETSLALLAMRLIDLCQHFGAAQLDRHVGCREITRSGLIGTARGEALADRAGCSRVFYLASARVAYRPAALRLWQSLVTASVELQRADGFTIDSTTPAGRTEGRAAEDRMLFQRLRVQPDDRRRVLRPIDGHLDDLRTIGPRVLSVDLYADGAWVAGTSDWGEEISLLFDDAAWRVVRDIIDALVPISRFDVAEADARPMITQ